MVRPQVRIADEGERAELQRSIRLYNVAAFVHVIWQLPQAKQLSRNFVTYDQLREDLPLIRSEDELQHASAALLKHVLPRDWMPEEEALQAFMGIRWRQSLTELSEIQALQQDGALNDMQAGDSWFRCLDEFMSADDLEGLLTAVKTQKHMGSADVRACVGTYEAFARDRVDAISTIQEEGSAPVLRILDEFPPSADAKATTDYMLELFKQIANGNDLGDRAASVSRSSILHSVSADRLAAPTRQRASYSIMPSSDYPAGPPTDVFGSNAKPARDDAALERATWLAEFAYGGGDSDEPIPLPDYGSEAVGPEAESVADAHADSRQRALRRAEKQPASIAMPLASSPQGKSVRQAAQEFEASKDAAIERAQNSRRSINALAARDEEAVRRQPRNAPMQIDGNESDDEFRFTNSRTAIDRQRAPAVSNKGRNEAENKGRLQIQQGRLLR